MTFPEHLSIDIEKIQSGVSRIDARNCARNILEGVSESCAFDADLLVAHACALSRLDFVTYPKEKLSAEQAASLKELVTRRAHGEPVAYLMGFKEFYGLNFFVNKHVLIPRPDTEVLVEAALDFLKDLPSPRVIDVCTGSGCVGIAIGHHEPKAQIVATDISAKAIEIAQENARLLKVLVDYRVGDLLEPCLKDGLVDLIVSNPPYIAPVQMSELMVDVRDFEPHLALVGEGEDGLGLHCKILAQSLCILRPGGVLLMEIGEGQAEILLNRKFSGFSHVEFLVDLSGIKRVAKYVRKGVIYG